MYINKEGGHKWQEPHIPTSFVPSSSSMRQENFEPGGALLNSIKEEYQAIFFSHKSPIFFKQISNESAKAEIAFTP